ncbi:uncharacterized protein LOC111033121 [Myzus persicae]|uniref:uncharacterized protein LOC111033121 n=1 Tax=Myzus persicae TaxID=13164 RepID=UPI000B932B15|nr:uncharacterized protein LOC111033121 [Myzus persicae]
MDRQRCNIVTVTTLMIAALLYAIDVFKGYLLVERVKKNVIVPEIVFKSYAVNHGAPINIKIAGRNSFTDFSIKIIKLENLFKQIHVESINLFEDVKSVKIVPYCISAEAFTNDEICFKNTEIYNLDNLKLESIELGRSTIHNKKTNRFLYVSHKFDELVISGTTDFMDVSNLDKYNTSIFNNNLIVYCDYNNQGIFSLEIPFLEGYSESNTDKYVAHAVDMHLKRAHDMTFHLPVRGFNGLLNLIENEMSTPSIFFPENITFSCVFSEMFGTKTDTISIDTKNIRLNKQLNNDVFNKVKFIKTGNSYQAQFAITFNKLAFTAKMSAKINQNLVLNEDVLIEIKKLHVEVHYFPIQCPLYKVKVTILNGVSLSTAKKIDTYFYSPHFNGKLSNCIKATTVHNVDTTLLMLKFPKLKAFLEANINASLM